MSKVKQLATAIAILPVLVTGVASAAPAGQIEGGDIYRVRNVTKNTGYTDPASADACETVQFKVRIHNPGPDALTGVTVKATLNTESATSHSSMVTVSADNANPASTTDTAGVNISTAQTMALHAGTTELLDANGAKLTTLGDTILTTGVSVPNGVGVSNEQQRFVQWQADIGCPPKTCQETNTCPVPPKPPVTPPTTVKPVAAPTTLVNTGAGDVAAIGTGAAIVGALGYRRFLSRRLAK